MQFPEDENGQLLREMSDEGVDLSAAHTVDFYHLFEKQPDAQAMAKAVNEAHPAEKVTVAEDPEIKGVWEVVCSLSMPLEHLLITESEQTFEAFADKNNGYSDGWGVMHQE